MTSSIRAQAARSGAEFELPGLNLGEVEHLVDEAERVHALQRLLCLFSSELGCVSDHHFGESNDDVERVRSSWLALDTNCDFMFDCPAQRDS